MYTVRIRTGGGGVGGNGSGGFVGTERELLDGQEKDGEECCGYSGERSHSGNAQTEDGEAATTSHPD